jgi:hypothetical protein
MISEYGGLWAKSGKKNRKGWGYGNILKSPAELVSRYRSLTKVLLENKYIAGFCYTQLYDVEQEINGLCNFNREPKINPNEIFKINKKKAAIERAGS